jgi:hypothetical protein
MKLSATEKSISSFLIIISLFATTSAFAAIDRALAPNSKKHHYIEQGTIIGGDTGSAFTLINARRIYSPKDNIERLLLELGDDHGRPLLNKISYFQVSIEKGRPRVVIELSQMLASSVDEAQLRKIFASSPNVEKVKINYDPIDTALSIQLYLKRNVQLEAFKLPSATKASRIAIDLKSKSNKIK